MANTVQHKRGTTAQVSSHTGAVGEFIYNTTTKRIHAQDGVTAGGVPHALVSEVNLKANESVTISAGAGLTGGGTLAANRTLALSSASIASLALADSAVQSVNGKTGSSITLTKADVGLSNVDNTSDANKPVSTATQTALNGKANSSVTVLAGSGLTGGGNLTANRSIALNAASISSLGKADTALQAPGGATGQILAKASADDNDVSWVTSEAATAVSYGPQTLTEAQQVQARQNIQSDKSYDSVAIVASSNVPPFANAIRTNGYYAAGDGGGALYKRTVVEPTHAGKVQSSDGAWWELSEVLTNPFMFGALGDGITDDTLAFTSLETYSTDNKIECSGHSFKVSKTFYRNIYLNCEWLVGSKKVPANGRLISNASPLDVSVLASEKAAAIRALPLAGGAGGQKTLQSFALDPRTRDLFTNHNTSMSGSDPSVTSVINRFKLDGIVETAVDNAEKDVRGGHQGLAIEYVNGVQKIWTTSPDAPENPANHPEFDYSIGASKGAIRFRYRKEADGELYDFEQFRLFEAARSTGSSTTPTISLDGNWLIVRVSEGGARNQVVRVFDMSLFTGSGDYSAMATHEFVWNYYDEMGTSVTSVSGFCSDGSHIYFFGGNNTFGQTQYLMSCTMLGDDKVTAVSDLGMTDFPRINGSTPTYMESEGMNWVDFDGKLYPGLVILANPSPFSGGTRRTAIIYALGARDLRDRNLISSRVSISGLPEDNPSTIYTEALDGDTAPALVFDSPYGTANLYKFKRNGATNLSMYFSTTNTVLAAAQGRDLGFGFIKTTGGGVDIEWKLDQSKSFRPNSNGLYDLGSSSSRVRNIYLTNAPNVSSDERLKTAITPLSENEVLAAKQIVKLIGGYHFLSGGKKVFGVGAQSLITIMEENKLDWREYNFIQLDQWDEQEEVIGDGGIIEQHYKPAGDMYSIRYEELAMFLIAALFKGV